MRALAEIAPDVLVCRARLYTTSTTVIRHGSRALLVDPALEPTELGDLASTMAEVGLTVAAGLATHAHYDHLLWHPGLGDPPRWASAATVEITRAHRADLLGQLGPVPEWLATGFGRVTAVTGTDAATPGTVVDLDWSGEPTQLVIHDAHAPGHTAVWLPRPRVLLAGDMLSDLELPLPQETGLAAYSAGLDVLLPWVEQAAVLVPGHGHPTLDPLRRWLADRTYLDAVMAGGDPDDARRAGEDMEVTHQANLALARVG